MYFARVFDVKTPSKTSDPLLVQSRSPAVLRWFFVISRNNTHPVLTRIGAVAPVCCYFLRGARARVTRVIAAHRSSARASPSAIIDFTSSFGNYPLVGLVLIEHDDTFDLSSARRQFFRDVVTKERVVVCRPDRYYVTRC